MCQWTMSSTYIQQGHHYTSTQQYGPLNCASINVVKQSLDLHIEVIYVVVKSMPVSMQGLTRNQKKQHILHQ